jgi:hypothetical protein
VGKVRKDDTLLRIIPNRVQMFKDMLAFRYKGKIALRESTCNEAPCNKLQGIPVKPNGEDVS